ncbi:M56 family metallopeptidase [Aquimarina sp. AU474]|uniref:M56 family metallopeptidase n=1 Tax=Aquimarina sp. AU474 TaxID=2108529 RepID=UPI000D6A01D7|nr:M56 family metallopeptidase [Aquimarina sp. AU474]
MDALLLYICKASAVLSIFYIVYHFMLRKDTFFTTNRHFLLTGILTSFALPFIEFTTIKLIESPNFYTIQATDINQIAIVTEIINWWQVGALVYGLGVMVFLIRFGIQLFSLKKLLIHNPTIKEGRFTLVEVKENISPFSFFNTIVYNRDLHSTQEMEMIISHEKIHAQQYHTIDLLMVNLLMITQWFNPLVWLYKRSLEQNLEFIADRGAINEVDSKKEYQLTLVRVSANNYSTIVNNFYQSLIKKRIVMLNKTNSKKKNAWKTIVVLPMLSLFLWGFNTKEIIKFQPNDPIVYETNYASDKGEEKTTKFMVNKNSSKAELEKIKTTLQNEYDVKVKFSSIKRNSNNEITSIKVVLVSKNSNTNYKISNNTPIKPFIISYDTKTNKTKISTQSIDTHSFVSVTSNGKGNSNSNSNSNSKSIKIHTNYDEDEDEDHDGKHKFIFTNGTKTKIVKDGEVIIEEFHGDDDDNTFEVHTEDHKTFAFVTGDHEGDPLIIIDGEKSTKKEMEKLDSDKIESVNVIKGKNAVEKYGKEAKNGVIVVITKKD